MIILEKAVLWDRAPHFFTFRLNNSLEEKMTETLNMLKET